MERADPAYVEVLLAAPVERSSTTVVAHSDCGAMQSPRIGHRPARRSLPGGEVGVEVGGVDLLGHRGGEGDAFADIFDHHH